MCYLEQTNISHKPKKIKSGHLRARAKQFTVLIGCHGTPHTTAQQITVDQRGIQTDGYRWRGQPHCGYSTFGPKSHTICVAFHNISMLWANIILSIISPWLAYAKQHKKGKKREKMAQAQQRKQRRKKKQEKKKEKT